MLWADIPPHLSLIIRREIHTHTGAHVFARVAFYTRIPLSLPLSELYDNNGQKLLWTLENIICGSCEYIYMRVRQRERDDEDYNFRS